MKDIKDYLEQTNTVLLTKEAFEWLKERASALDKVRAEIHATAELHEDGDYYLRDEWIDEIFDKYQAEVEKLQPVTPKQKMGRWIREKKHHKDDFQEFDYWDVRCSECGARKRIGWTNVRHCPMCGAKMSENPTGSNSEEESEDE